MHNCIEYCVQNKTKLIIPCKLSLYEVGFVSLRTDQSVYFLEARNQKWP